MADFGITAQRMNKLVAATEDLGKFAERLKR
jgi:hypothetical protein